MRTLRRILIFRAPPDSAKGRGLILAFSILCHLGCDPAVHARARGGQRMTTLTAETIDLCADDRNGRVALHLKQKLLPVEGEGT